jgi:phage terminase large subunit-like protein
MAARPNGQLWVVSTAGNRKSAYWRSKVDAGRMSAALGVTEGTCFVEWAAPSDVDVTDQTCWSTFMPALGRTIAPETVEADLRSMPASDWRRAYANQWPDESDEGWAVIPREAWMAARL